MHTYKIRPNAVWGMLRRLDSEEGHKHTHTHMHTSMHTYMIVRLAGAMLGGLAEKEDTNVLERKQKVVG